MGIGFVGSFCSCRREIGASVSPPNRDVAKFCQIAPDGKHGLRIQPDRELTSKDSGGLQPFREAPWWMCKVSMHGVRGPLDITQS